MLMKVIVLPNLLTNPVYVNGLEQPLNDIAEILDEQNKPEHARSIRDAITIIKTYKEICLDKSAILHINT